MTYDAFTIHSWSHKGLLLDSQKELCIKTILNVIIGDILHGYDKNVNHISANQSRNKMDPVCSIHANVNNFV